MSELFEYWQLLLVPLFFGLGWAAARLDIRQVVHESRALPRSYFQGLNFLLNEQPDKAIDSFLEVAKVDSQTVELHFALGNLFRRRGETERAIRMHQNLIDRPDLEEGVRLHALSELGQDFLKAGLLDRAEEIFNRLVGTSFEDEAKRNLLEIYQVEKDWQKAIDLARELPEVASQQQVAEFFCELAAGEIMRSRPDSARAFLESAMQQNRKCVRASLLQGDLLLQEENPEGAIAAWQRVEQQDPAYLALVAQRLLETYRKLERRDEGIALLELHLERIKASAGELGFAFDRHAVRNAIQALCFEADAPSRVRLVVSRAGAYTLELSPLPAPLPDPAQCAVLRLPVDAGDWRLRHKTTDRGFYDVGLRAAKEAGAQEALLLRDDGLVTEGCFTNLFVERGGILLTPPAALGLLPGVLRRNLIEAGRAAEAELALDDLKDGFMIGNALRGLVKARLL